MFVGGQLCSREIGIENQGRDIWQGLCNMDEKTRNILTAADKWLTAINAVTAAGEGQNPHDAESEQTYLDAAEVELAAAILNWRLAGRPD